MCNGWVSQELLKSKNIYNFIREYKPVPAAALCTAWILATGVVGFNPTQGMHVCPCLSLLCGPVSVEALRRADPPSRQSYRMSS
jgi:hypothetical protein